MPFRERTYTYIWIRKDLPMHYQIIQAAHAAHEIGLQQEDSPGENNIILFEVSCEEELQQISRYLNAIGIRHHMFHEPDHKTGYTAIATRLILADDPIRSAFRDFKMWTLDKQEDPVILLD